MKSAFLVDVADRYSVNESGLLVVSLPKDSTPTPIKDKIAQLKPPPPPMPQSPSGLFSLANLQNLSVSDDIAPRARRHTDSAIAFIRELEPPKPPVAQVTEAKASSTPFESQVAKPPAELGLPSQTRRPWLVPVVVILGLCVGGAFTLWFLKLDSKSTPEAVAAPATKDSTPPPVPETPVPKPPVGPMAVATTKPGPAVETPDTPAPQVTERTHKLKRRRRGKRSGELSRRQLRRVMRRIRYRVKRCFWRRNKRGRAKVELSILGSGEVQSLRITRTPGKRVQLCVAKQVRKARFPRFPAASMTYAYTFIVR
jgi:hypothetical protein